VRRLILILVLAQASCGSASELACEDLGTALRAFYRAKCAQPIAQILIDNLDGILGCSRVIGVRDERALREECFPAMAGLTCSFTMTWPESCTGQFYYGAPPLF
jgi:hypothetical protein